MLYKISTQHTYTHDVIKIVNGCCAEENTTVPYSEHLINSVEDGNRKKKQERNHLWGAAVPTLGRQYTSAS